MWEIRKSHLGTLLERRVSLSLSQIQKAVTSWYWLPSLMSEINFTSARFKQEWPTRSSAVNI